MLSGRWGTGTAGVVVVGLTVTACTGAPALPRAGQSPSPSTSSVSGTGTPGASSPTTSSPTTCSPTASSPTASSPTASGALAPAGDLAQVPEVAAQLQPSVVTVVVDGGNGSGVVYTADGLILTNEHVVRGNRAVQIAFADGQRVPGRSPRPTR